MALEAIVFPTEILPIGRGRAFLAATERHPEGKIVPVAMAHVKRACHG
jgi:hypothetical protein